MNESLSIAILDDDQLIVELLSDYIEMQPDMQVKFTANGQKVLFELLSEQSLPEIIILDLKIKDGSGIDIARSLLEAYPAIKIVVLTSHYQHSFTGFFVKLGVSAFLPKGISPSELMEILREVKERNHYFQPEQIPYLQQQISSKAPTPVLDTADALSPREIDVLRLLCRQKTAKQIGEELFITARTVEGHKNSLFAKTGQKNLAGLVIYAIQRSLVSIEELPIL